MRFTCSSIYLNLIRNEARPVGHLTIDKTMVSSLIHQYMPAQAQYVQYKRMLPKYRQCCEQEFELHNNGYGENINNLVERHILK